MFSIIKIKIDGGKGKCVEERTGTRFAGSRVRNDLKEERKQKREPTAEW